MIDLLINSLMTDQGLEDALVTAIAYEAQDPAALLKATGTESSLPLMQLLQQLLSNATAKQLAFLKQVPACSKFFGKLQMYAFVIDNHYLPKLTIIILEFG